MSKLPVDERRRDTKPVKGVRRHYGSGIDVRFATRCGCENIIYMQAKMFLSSRPQRKREACLQA